MSIRCVVVQPDAGVAGWGQVLANVFDHAVGDVEGRTCDGKKKKVCVG